MKIYTAERLNPCCSFLYGTEKQIEFDLGEKILNMKVLSEVLDETDQL